MDGTLVDSEKLWDISLNELYNRHGGVLTPEVRAATVGGSAEGVIRIVFDDLGLDPDPEHMAESADWMHDYIGELFDGGLPWCPGARELLDALAADVSDGTGHQHPPGADRACAEQHWPSTTFRSASAVTRCRAGKPAPDVYLRAAALLGLDPSGDCLAIEDSVTGTAAAEDAGCPVLVVPNDVEVPVTAPAPCFVADRAGHPELRQIYADLRLGLGERSA